MQKTVLIVDGNRMSRIMISTIIKAHHPDWSIIDAAHGEEALKKTTGREIQLMVLDMNTPDTDVLTLASRLRQQFQLADIVLITADQTDAAAANSNFAFLAKPITENKLMDYINSTN